MKALNLFAVIIITTLLISSCTNRKSEEQTRSVALAGSSFITVDSANKMIQSYLTSIATVTPTDSILRSVIVDGDGLRDYLADTSIKSIKIMFAHNLDYINSGHGGQNAGYSSKGLSFVLAGFDAAGNYVLHQGLAMDRGLPCPPHCPITGSASQNILPSPEGINEQP